MSALNSFRILSKKDNVILVEVCLIHPDEHHINDSYNFALQILVELYEFIKLGYFQSFAYSPLDKKAHEQLISEKNKPLLEHFWGLMRGAEGTYQPQYDTFCEQADLHIDLVEVLSVDCFPHWADRFETWLQYQKPAYELTNEEFEANPESKECPSYQLRITVNPSSDFLFAHVVEGCSWDSACYNFWNYTESYEETKQSLRHCLNYSTNTNPPADEVLQTWWDGLNEVWQHYFRENLSAQKHELPSYIIEHFTLPLMPRLIREYSTKDISLSDLRLISQLKYFNVSYENIHDISNISILKNLKILNIDGGYFTDISVLQHITSLEHLDIFGNSNIKDFSTLQSLKKLQHLSFTPQNQHDLEQIRPLQNLRTLILGDLFFDFDYSVFEQLPKLNKLSGFVQILSETQLSVLQNLHQKGVEIEWNVLDEAKDDYDLLEF
jgi:hypothetical protein